MLATELQLPATSLAQVVGHADGSFTLKLYARDARSQDALVADVLTRAASAQVGG